MKLLACIVSTLVMLSIIAIMAVHQDAEKRRLEKLNFQLQRQQTIIEQCLLAFPEMGEYYDECVSTWGQ